MNLIAPSQPIWRNYCATDLAERASDGWEIFRRTKSSLTNVVYIWRDVSDSIVHYVGSGTARRAFSRAAHPGPQDLVIEIVAIEQGWRLVRFLEALMYFALKPAENRIRPPADPTRHDFEWAMVRRFWIDHLFRRWPDADSDLVACLPGNTVLGLPPQEKRMTLKEWEARV